jgi:hypothetical protein
MNNTIRPLSTDTNLPTMKRRAFACLAFGGAAALALSACGGGGGGDGDSSGDASEPLRAVFLALTPGLTEPEVRAMVSFAPQDNTPGSLRWDRGTETLRVGFNILTPGSPATATTTSWSGSGSREEQRSLTGI